jgi:hypothetical protein
MIMIYGMEYWLNEDWEKQLRYRRKTCPIANLFTTDTTLTVLKLKKGLRK